MVGAFRRSEPLRTLEGAGLSAEAMILSDARLFQEAETLVEAGKVLTACCPEYPARWLAVLGSGAPPVLWRDGPMPCSQEFVAIVGSRYVEPRVLRFCLESARACSQAGYAVVSGGAQGCDAAAAEGAGEQIVEILAHGHRLASSGRVSLSLAAPHEPFSTALAMERNALIYAAGRVALVGHARFKQGGSWHGSVAALRRRLTPIGVRDDGSAACQAMAGLGAIKLVTPEDFLSFAEGQGEALQPALSFAV